MLYAFAFLCSTAASVEIAVAQTKTDPLSEAEVEAEIQVLRSKADDAATSGQREQAIELFQRIVSLKSKFYGPTSPELSSECTKLAELLRLTGDYAAQEVPLAVLLEIQIAAYGEEHWVTNVFRRKLDDAKLYQQLSGEQRQTLDSAQQQFVQAAKLLEQGEYRQSLPEFENCLRIRSELLREGHYLTAQTRNQVAKALLKLDLSSQAEAVYRRNLETNKERYLGDKDAETGESLNELGMLYYARGELREAELLLRRALKIRKAVLLPHSLEKSDTLFNLGMVLASFHDQGLYQEAEKHYLESLRICEAVVDNDHPNIAVRRINLALLYFEQEEYAKGDPLFEKGFAVLKSAWGADHPRTITCLAQLADRYYSEGWYSQAEPLYVECLQRRIAVLGENHLDTIQCRNRLGRLYLVQGHSEKAEPLLREALQSSRASVAESAITQSERQQFAHAAEQRILLDAYLSLAIAAPQYVDGAYDEILVWKGAATARNRRLQRLSADPAVAVIYDEFQKTTSMLATLARINPDAKAYEQWREQVTELTQTKEQLQIKLLQATTGTERDIAQGSTEEVKSSLPENGVLIDYLVYYRIDTSEEEPPKPRYIRSVLAFVVRRDEPLVLVDLGPVAQIHQMIELWRGTFGMSAKGAEAGQWLRQTLWQPIEKYLVGTDVVLISADGALGRLPFSALPGKTPESFLLQEYRLAMLPIPRLLPELMRKDPSDGSTGGILLLGDVDYDAGLESAETRSQMMPLTRSNITSVRGDLSFAPLSATSTEVATIRRLFLDSLDSQAEHVKTLTQKAASEQEFRSIAQGFRTLHLATHGFFIPEAKFYEENFYHSGLPKQQDDFKLRYDREQLIREFNPGLLAGLALSGANGLPQPGQDDGVLTADEIASLHLDGVDLVVLSACETGLGEAAGAEGLLGVERAFQVAGAKSTVASLWQVDDVATCHLMEAFYRNYLEKKMSKVDALREVQLDMILHPDTFRDIATPGRGDRRLRTDNADSSTVLSPEFWAAFTISGDWR